VQALLQHTPWAQKPDAHSVPALHSAPGGFRPQEVLTQKLPETHWLSVVHVLKQLLALHWNGLQLGERGATHWPEALQVDCGVYEAAAHFSGAQTSPTGYFWHAPLPSHAPLVPQEEAPLSLQVRRGSWEPLATSRHWPGEPGKSQLRQGPLQLLSQHTPSTHCVESHSPESAQGCPFCFLPQESRPVASFAHAMPGAQSASVAQPGLHAPLLHM